MRNWILDFVNEKGYGFDGRTQNDGSDFWIVDGWSSFKDFNLFLKANGYETETQLRDEEGVEWFEEIIEKENENVEWGFADEYYFCDRCGEANRYDEPHWTDEDGRYCDECVSEMASDYINEYLVLNYERGIPKDHLPINCILDRQTLIESGFKCIKEDLEVGWYGTYDDPVKLLEKLTDEHTENDYICNCTNYGNPFATEYEIWERVA